MGFSAAGARQKLVELNQAHQAKLRAEADRLRLMAEFADQYRWVPDEGPVLAGTERLVQWGGEGTPGVAEFCTLEVAAALRMSEEAVRAEIGIALAVRHRLPGVWALTMAGRVRVWQATELASITGDLGFEQACGLDEELAPLLDTMAYPRVRALAKARVLDLLRVAAQSERERAMARRRVEFSEPVLGTTDVSGALEAGDALRLDSQLNRLATILGKAGVEGSRDVRRAQALALLANPARALQLMQASLTDQLPELDAQCQALGQPGHACGTITVEPDLLLPTAHVVVHLTDESLRTGEGLVRSARLGPLLTGWLGDLVGHSRINVRPVLDPTQLVPTDAYECPPRMREWVELRNPHEPFPFSKRLTSSGDSTRRSPDLDHTIPWEPTPRSDSPTSTPWETSRHRWIDQLAGDAPPGPAGDDPPPDVDPPPQPPGQTRPDNLAPLSRKVHRAKTHGGWKLTQPHPGTFLWTSPLGFGYLVTPSQSWLVHDPTRRLLPTPAAPDLTLAS